MGDILLQEADVIKSGINGLKSNVKSLQLQYKQALFALTPEQTNKISADIQRITEDTNGQIHKIKAQLDALRRSADATGDRIHLYTTRLLFEDMRHNMAESLAGKFSEVLQQYQKAQNEYAEKIKAKMIQKVRIVRPEASPEEIESAIEDGSVDKMFTQGTLDAAHLHGQAKNALAYVQDRHNDIRAIEASVRELNQLFVDMAILVNNTGVMLDNIEDNVNSAVLNTGSGAESLGKAVKDQKKGRKKLYIIIFVMIVIAIIAIAGGLGGAL